MLRARSIGGILCRFAIIYALLVAPWPGWKENCASYLRAIGGSALVLPAGPAVVSIELLDNRSQTAADTRFVIVNRELMSRDGSGPVRNLDLDLGRLGANSLALWLALLVATPISWKRRAWSFLSGWLILHACILGLLKYCIWAESAELALVELSPAAKAIAAGLELTLVAQFSVTVPVLTWLVATFRREDLGILPGRVAGGERGRVALEL